MTIAMEVKHRQGDFLLAASFASGDGVTAFFGASGSGKTTLVNILAGLIRPDHARIVVDGRVLTDTAAGVNIPVHKRRIGYVFQEARLFPHLSVERNLRYGRSFAPRGEADAVPMEDVIEMLGIGHLLARRPASLSGGEKQRVAIGRALLANPRLILMDEPLASLDGPRKAEILPYLERLRDESRVPIVYVSHSVAEVARLANEVVVLGEGQVRAAGPADEVLQRLDLLPEGERAEVGALVAITVVAQDPAFGLTQLSSSAGNWVLPRVDAAEGSVVRVRVRARDVMLAVGKPEGISALNVLECTVAALSTGEGPETVVRLDSGSDRLVARITRRSASELQLVPGQRIYAIVKTVTFDESRAR